MLHKEIFSSSQQALFPLIKNFCPKFFLCGGTAIALHIGHRESIDFDLFTTDDLNINILRKKLSEVDKDFSVLVKNEDEYTVVVRGVKVTFLCYPFPFDKFLLFEDIARVPDLLTLAAMKAYALGRRSKWKDYIDLYFILSRSHTLVEIIKRAEMMFGNEFNEKVFRAALAYFEDIDYSEAVSFRPGFQIDDEYIRSELKRLSVEDGL
ncbi:MAG: nucleotidyl transferase AbiEii/AbiGii toxin family protein [Candidatus Moranbacteria bacterium]|nr:nucleotidyl transferase AbiEii/AbiGii toxin family protein [Candidatus Moranbacteria bacterium]